MVSSLTDFRTKLHVQCVKTYLIPLYLFTISIFTMTLMIGFYSGFINVNLHNFIMKSRENRKILFFIRT